MVEYRERVRRKYEELDAEKGTVEGHKITYRSGRYTTELDLLVVRQQQLSRVKDCKTLAG